MTKDAKEMLEMALCMPAGDRALVAQKLLLSLERELDEDVDAAWQLEAARRLEELRHGDVAPVTWKSLRDRLRNKKRATG